MVDKIDYRNFVVDHPGCREKTQREAMDGATYSDFDKLLRSLRPGSVVRVFRPYLLGGAAGSTAKRRNLWADRADRAKAKGNKLVSFDPPLSGHKLTMLAYEQIGNIARGKAGVAKSGRPKKAYTPEQLAVIRHHWPPRRGVTTEQAIDTINAAIKPAKVVRGWLYANVK